MSLGLYAPSSNFSIATQYLNQIMFGFIIDSATYNAMTPTQQAEYVLVNTAGGSGTVTSVGLSVPSFLSVSGSPVTTAGTLSVSLSNQVANSVFAGPSTGSAAQPAFRALLPSDIIGPVQQVASTSVTKKIIYVSQDTGNDLNDGSLFLPFKTIQTGINSANLIAAYYNQVIVLVTPSTTSNGYNENITFTQQGVVLQAASNLYRSDSCVLHGSVTINLSGTSGGSNFIASLNTVYIHGFTIVSVGSDAIIFSGSVFQRLFITNSFVQCTFSTGSALNMTNTGVNGGTKSTITSRDTDYESNSLTVATFVLGAGRLFLAGSAPSVINKNAAGPSFNLTGANASGPVLTVNNADITGQMLVPDNTANVTMSLYILRSGSLPAIVTASSPSTGLITLGTGAIQTSAANSITGSGVVAPAGENAKISTGGDIAASVTQVVIPKFPEGQTLLGAGATAITNSMLIIKDGHWTSQRTTAPTTTVSANAGTGATSTVANASDTAGILNLTLGSIGTLSSGVQTTLNFNKVYSVAPIVVVTPRNSVTASNVATFGVFVTSTTAGFSINFATAGVATDALSWFYHVIETQ